MYNKQKNLFFGVAILLILWFLFFRKSESFTEYKSRNSVPTIDSCPQNYSFLPGKGTLCFGVDENNTVPFITIKGQQSCPRWSYKINDKCRKMAQTIHTCPAGTETLIGKCFTDCPAGYSIVPDYRYNCVKN